MMILRITKLTRSLNRGFHVTLSNGVTLSEVKAHELSSPTAFATVLKQRGVADSMSCPGATPTERQKSWNAQIGPLVHAAETEVPRWRDENYWKNAG